MKRFPVDVLISPEQVVTNYIKRLIQHPGALQVIDFADARRNWSRFAPITAGRWWVSNGASCVNTCRTSKPAWPPFSVATGRSCRRAIRLIEADDEVCFIAAKANIRAVTSRNAPSRRNLQTHCHRQVAGRSASALAEAIESRYQVKIHRDEPGALPSPLDDLDSTVVLQGSASDRDLLLEENIADADLFLALTNGDEANIMSVATGASAGAKKAMTITNNPAYVDPIQGGDIDHRHQPATGDHRHRCWPTYARRHRQRALVAPWRGRSYRGDCPRRCEIKQGDRQGSSRTSACRLAPPSARLSATEEVIIAHDDTDQAGDHVILFACG